MTCRFCFFVIIDAELTRLKGDERPCQRCIKRGLQDACHDGVRKKAKYLHDAPNEALIPGVGGQNLFNHAAALRNNMAIQNAEAAQQEAGQFYQNSPPYANYAPTRSMPPPMMQDSNINAPNFAQPSPVSPSFNLPGQPTLHTSSIGQSQPDPAAGMPQNWNGALFDPNDPSLFNFDLASMNFGNHYGALEFGMLGHMATGAGETPPSDSATQSGSISHSNGSNQFTLPLGSFSESPTQQFAYNDAIMGDWPGGQSLYGQQFGQPSDAPHAFAIETNTANFTSPDSASSPQQGITKFEDSPTMTYKSTNIPPTPTSGVPRTSNIQAAPHPHSHPRQHSHLSTPQLKSRSQLPSRHAKRRDPSSIYNTVTAPYPYTSGFHSLIAYLQRRFAASPSKTLTIAKSLASIRPSFIATTKTLNRDDLIFMEKCFQRTLWEYEGFIEGVGTPTIVARRTGEVAAVGKEFSILTGWKKDVLLGREPNLNVNRGGTANGSAPGSGVNSAGRGTGMNTPSQRNVAPPPPDDWNADGKGSQPVFLAELLDDESVVEFYEGFARLAFGDSRGSVMGKGKLLKYRTKEDLVAQNLKDESGGSGGEMKMEDVQHQNQQQQQHPGNLKRISSGMVRQQRELKRGGIANEREMGQRLGERDGKVECTICWTVKRDVFDIPMLIVMNVSPPFPSSDVTVWGWLTDLALQFLPCI
jgi:hypothetical protein